MREFALRALADRKPFLDKVPIEPFLKGLKDTSARVQAASIIALGRLGRKEAAPALLQIPVPPSFKPVPKGEIGPHATPNSKIILPHLAAHALDSLHAVDACVNAIGTENSTLALWALRYMHNPKAVDGLISAFKKTGNKELENEIPFTDDQMDKEDKNLKKQILFTLARLYQKEAPYDGTWWWGTRPDTHGPYYQPVTWESSDKIKTLLVDVWNNSNTFGKQFFADLNGKYRLGIHRFGGEEEELPIKNTKPKIDLNKIRNKKGQIGKSSIEDIMLAMDKIKGNPALGKKLFIQQGCITCHSIKKGEKLKGPFMGQIGSIMNRKQIAESILKPSASISQGFATTLITTKDGKTLTGFVTAQSSERVVLRDITGAVHVVKAKDIAQRKELEKSMMPTGMANALSYEEFASLITYLSQQKE
jgi:putative heme-binding domain-containing protein